MEDLEFINKAVVSWSLLVREARENKKTEREILIEKLNHNIDQDQLILSNLSNFSSFFDANRYYKLLKLIVDAIGMQNVKDLLNQITIDSSTPEDCSTSIFKDKVTYYNWPYTQANLVRLTVCLEYYYPGYKGIELVLLVMHICERGILKINNKEVNIDSFYSAFSREKKNYDYILYSFIDEEITFSELCKEIGEKAAKSLLNLEETVNEYYCIIIKNKIE